MNKDNKNKSVWDDITRIWGRIAAVITAVGTISVLLVKLTNAPAELTYSIFACLGIVLLMVSFYVDKQAQYTYEKIDQVEKDARTDFTEAMEAQKEMQDTYKRDSDSRLESFREAVNEVINTTKETRKDTLRIQLLMLLQQQPENIDTILKLAQTYFVELHGDWYMSSEFSKWAKKHEVEVPQYIYKAIEDTHKKFKDI